MSLCPKWGRHGAIIVPKQRVIIPPDVLDSSDGLMYVAMMNYDGLTHQWGPKCVPAKLCLELFFGKNYATILTKIGGASHKIHLVV